MKYRLKSIDGRTVEVEAKTERKAREKAMDHFYGPPKQAWCTNRGEGLDLQELTSTS